jgi:hypothetical protein
MSEESQAPGQVTPDSGQRAGGSAPPAQQPNGTAQPAQLPQHVVKRTRMGGLWLASGSFAVVLLLLLIFILENSKSVDVAYFGAHGHVPLGRPAAGRRAWHPHGGDPRHGTDRPAAADGAQAPPRGRRTARREPAAAVSDGDTGAGPGVTAQVEGGGLPVTWRVARLTFAVRCISSVMNSSSSDFCRGVRGVCRLASSAQTSTR